MHCRPYRETAFAGEGFITWTSYQTSRLPLIGSFTLALALILGSAGATIAQVGTPAATPAGTLVTVAQLEPTPCATRYQLPEPVVDGQNVFCAHLSVPAFSGKTGSPVLQLHAVHFTSSGSAPATEPLLLLNRDRRPVPVNPFVAPSRDAARYHARVIQRQSRSCSIGSCRMTASTRHCCGPAGPVADPGLVERRGTNNQGALHRCGPIQIVASRSSRLLGLQ